MGDGGEDGQGDGRSDGPGRGSTACGGGDGAYAARRCCEDVEEVHIAAYGRECRRYDCDGDGVHSGDERWVSAGGSGAGVDGEGCAESDRGAVDRESGPEGDGELMESYQ